MQSHIIEQPPVRAKPAIDLELLFSIHPELLNDSYVYVHCKFDNPHPESLLRVWRTTFLVDQASGTRSSLVHAENISYAPQWTLVPNRGVYTFLLIFQSLPKSCRVFDLIEEISQPGGFFVPGIARNQKDIYEVWI